jgi:hypothetical protein
MRPGRAPGWLGWAAAIVLAAPAAASGDEFSEFEIPEHRWHSVGGTANASAARSVDSSPLGQSKSGRSFGDLFSNGSWGFDSDDRQWTVTLGLGLTGSRSHSSATNRFSSATVSSVGSDEVASRLTEERAALAGEWRHYPWTAPAGIQVRGDFVVGLRQAWLDQQSDSRTLTPTLSLRNVSNVDGSQKDYSYRASGAVAVGWGRVRDATGVYRAHVVEQRLLADGAIMRPLSKGARERLAGVYFVEARYAEPHDNPTKFVWRDIERILREDGALVSGSLDAYALLHALERYGPQRQRGWFAGPSIVLGHTHRIARSASHDSELSFVADTLASSVFVSTSTRSELSEDDVLAGGEAELHLPMGWRWQLDAAGQALFDVKGVDEGMAVTSSLGLRYTVAERWDASASVGHSRATDLGLAPPVATNEGWTAFYGGRLDYFLEDRTTVGLSLFENQGRSGDPFSSRGYRRSGRVTLNLSYLFSGGLDAPGLIDPVRPRPGGTLYP